MSNIGPNGHIVLEDVLLWKILNDKKLLLVKYYFYQIIIVECLFDGEKMTYRHTVAAYP